MRTTNVFFTTALIPFALIVACLLAGCATSKVQKPDGLSGPSPAVRSDASIVQALEPVTGAGRVLVVYFSQGNATRAVAEDLAALTGADLEAIVELKNRAGFFGFMGAGMDATMGTATPIAGPFYNPARYDVVFVCTPVWAWHLCPPVRSWLRMYSGKFVKAAFVTVSGDTQPDKIVAAMIEESGVEPFASDGFSERDLYPENRDSYVARLAALVEPLR